jgi:hypothetical protein
LILVTCFYSVRMHSANIDLEHYNTTFAFETFDKQPYKNACVLILIETDLPYFVKSIIIYHCCSNKVRAIRSFWIISYSTDLHLKVKKVIIRLIRTFIVYITILYKFYIICFIICLNILLYQFETMCVNLSIKN